MMMKMKMSFLLLLLCCTAHLQPVSLQDRGRAVLSGGDHPCEGHVQVYYQNTPGYVGDKHWNRSTEEVVCRSTCCGTPVKGTKDVQRSMNDKVWLNELKCNGNESSLWDCPGSPGPGISFYQKSTVKKLKCSNRVSFQLKPFRCEGAVHYSILNSADNQSSSGYFCNDNWGENEARLLCESLGCGGLKTIPDPKQMAVKEFLQSQKMKINCAGIVNVANLWQCVAEQRSTCTLPASVTCQNHKRLQLKGNQSNVCSGQLEEKTTNTWREVQFNRSHAERWCQEMNCGSFKNFTTVNGKQQLTCTDTVRILLSSKCFGTVHVEVNGEKKSVCSSDWTEKESQMVCSELSCGKVIGFRRQSSSAPRIMDHVKCSGGESSLWYCKAMHDKVISCQVSHIICSGSTDVKLKDGPGRCAGRLEVQHEGQWKRVQNKDWTSEYSDIVCKQLNCGNATQSSPKFIKGSGDFLTVNCRSNPQEVSDISECIDADTSNQRGGDEEPVHITCQEHKAVILSETCSGKVGIEQGDQVYWLSGSNETWTRESADTVCQQMHCGNAQNFTHQLSDSETAFWRESRNCSTTKKSLFECEETPLPDDYNQTIATVNCSGTISVDLTDRCMGNVNICAEGQCGGLCRDTWTDENSETLCRNLGCGKRIRTEFGPAKSGAIMFKSLHSRSGTNLSQSHFIRMETSRGCSPAYVVCSGSLKPRFTSSRDKCSGNVELYYEGRWLPVQMTALQDNKTQDTICRELSCGTGVRTLPYFGPQNKEEGFIKELECADTSLADCNMKAQSILESKTVLGGLQCSDWATMALEVEDSCKGQVVVHSDKQRTFVSSQGWTDAEGEKLCNVMNCGTFKSSREPPAEAGESSWSRTFNCSAATEPEGIWDCETEIPASGNKKLFIECEGEPTVRLAGRCSGELRINRTLVCSGSWDLSYANRVCQELDCGNAVPLPEDLLASGSRGNHYHVRCDQHHYKLAQCKRVAGPCDGSVSVYCTETVKFKFEDTCGGLIKVDYGKGPKYVSSMNKDLKNNLCKKLECGSEVKEEERILPMRDMTTSLECPTGCSDLRYCIKHHDPKKVKPPLVFCSAYKERKVDSNPDPVSPTTIVLGIGIALVLVILIAVCVRYYIVREENKGRMSPTTLSGRDVEFDSGEYEDADKLSEMDDVTSGTFRADAESMGREKVSTSSLHYDDIDEVAEDQPLTSGFTAALPRDKYLQEEELDQQDDGVTYEVDDIQEGYDDIDASSEVLQTTVEVHDAPVTTSESRSVEER